MFSSEPHKFTEILIRNVDENSSAIHGTLDTLLLNATAVSEKLYGKSKPCNNLRTALRKQIEISAKFESTLVINSIINIHLPLMIFIRMHSQESLFHIKCLICSIMSIFVRRATFVSTFGKQIQSHEARSLVAGEMSKSSVTVRRNMSNDVWNQSLECF